MRVVSVHLLIKLPADVDERAYETQGWDFLRLVIGKPYTASHLGLAKAPRCLKYEYM